MAMITAEDLKAKFNQYYEVGYETLVKMGCDEILANENTGPWQGDEHFLLRKGDEYAHLIVGYGSCEICDALASCENFEDVAELGTDIVSRIIWRTKAEIAQYLKEHDAKGSWYGDGEDWQRFVASSEKALGEVA